ncbi:non-hydrolyzing UDP-N-acetylglucosamine 2-epimerase [Niabella soli]|uniref:UDP-N-acetylglucosamine 2-epimerase (non-hydrolyzing) n=1 Tax=Niabella soli DSM 19437 TaxID=929713 RepID=W0EYR8_9BACT|nr:UDP-N-acetylglucosamine 2-epimerase (non-hydrolyzing) [Niabella soli]AHF14216.1 UDP-N-acetylglucosamine 2-epimerase [Niabella soli DSM 19437]
MYKALIVFGTRPEAIKMAPLVLKMKADNFFDVRVCVTAQHREMLDQVLDFFKITPDYDLNIMQSGQTLHQLTARLLEFIKPVFDDFKPDSVFVHGDTTTSMATSLAAFYSGVPICHIEAGLRTHNIYSPFPEEANRRITGMLGNFHFAPTTTSQQNLLNEGIAPEHICVTGNTVIDALLESVSKIDEGFSNPEIEELKKKIIPGKNIVLVTGHRRENHGQGFQNICEALLDVSNLPDVQIIYPVHLNPNVKDVVYARLSAQENISLVSPLSYPSFIWLMNQSKIILTDSGGIQEEAPSLGKPVLVMRDTTERPEALDAGTVILVGTDREKIFFNCKKLLEDDAHYQHMSRLRNPYGDGKASQRVAAFIKQKTNILSDVI